MVTTTVPSPSHPPPTHRGVGIRTGHSDDGGGGRIGIFSQGDGVDGGGADGRVVVHVADGDGEGDGLNAGRGSLVSGRDHQRVAGVRLEVQGRGHRDVTGAGVHGELAGRGR